MRKHTVQRYSFLSRLAWHARSSRTLRSAVGKRIFWGFGRFPTESRPRVKTLNAIDPFTHSTEDWHDFTRERPVCLGDGNRAFSSRQTCYSSDDACYAFCSTVMPKEGGLADERGAERPTCGDCFVENSFGFHVSSEMTRNRLPLCPSLMTRSHDDRSRSLQDTASDQTDNLVRPPTSRIQ